MTLDTKFMELIWIFLNYLRFVNYSVVKSKTTMKTWTISQIPDWFILFDCKWKENDCDHILWSGVTCKAQILHNYRRGWSREF